VANVAFASGEIQRKLQKEELEGLREEKLDQIDRILDL
jgi:hypothetical protein